MYPCYGVLHSFRGQTWCILAALQRFLRFGAERTIRVEEPLHKGLACHLDAVGREPLNLRIGSRIIGNPKGQDPPTCAGLGSQAKSQQSFTEVKQDWTAFEDDICIAEVDRRKWLP